MDPGDSAYFAWAMGWEVHALKTRPAMLPHANIFHPHRYAFGYHGVIGLIIVPLALLPLLWGRWRRLPVAGLAAIVAGLALLPLYWLQRAALDQVGFARGREETIFYAASLESFLATSSWN